MSSSSFERSSIVTHFTNRQTRRELGTQSHGTLEVRRATERKQPRRMPGITLTAPRPALGYSRGGVCVLPADMPQGHASGPAPYRFLLAGGESVAGRGVRSHDLGLVGCLARSIAGQTGHGTDVDLLVSEKPGLSSLDAVLRRQRLDGIDGVVLVVGPGRHPRGTSIDGAELRALLATLIDRMPDGSPITVVAAPQLDASGAAAIHETRYARFLDAVAAAARPFASFVGLSTPRPGATSAAERYRRWGQEIAEVLGLHLLEPKVWRDPDRQVDEPARQGAVRRLGALDEIWESGFDRFVALARGAYGTRSAALSVIDGPWTRFLARQGIGVGLTARENTLCDPALSAPGGLIVGDARQESRYRDILPVRTGDAVFYAGYPVESPDGHPVAVLCVFDPEPRPVLAQDIAPLRDFALAAQRRIWELQRLPHRDGVRLRPHGDHR
jgi:hypothetical protein